MYVFIYNLYKHTNIVVIIFFLFYLFELLYLFPCIIFISKIINYYLVFNSIRQMHLQLRLLWLYVFICMFLFLMPN